MVRATLKAVASGMGGCRTSPGRRALERQLLVGVCWVILVSCATNPGAAQRRLEKAQTNVFEASYDETFQALVEVLSRDYDLTRVEPESGLIETAPKPDVVLNTGPFRGFYSLKARVAVARMGGERTKVRLRVLAGRLLDFVENRKEYRDFGTSQYYREYFRKINAVVRERKAPMKRTE